MDNILMPNYMTGFRCTGGACPQNCCDENWIIAVEDRITEKYRRIQDPDLAPLFQKYIQKIPDPKITGFSRLEKLPNGKCPFQSERGFCIIHERYGTEYLSGVCNTYPRHINKVNGVFEISGKVSCPEVCRLALFNPEPMGFQSCRTAGCIDPQAAYIFTTINITPQSVPAQVLIELRDFTIRILQERSAPVIDRLVFLGLFYKKVKEYLRPEKSSRIRSLIGEYGRMLQAGGARGLTSDINANYSLKLELILAICNIKANSDVNFAEFFHELLAGIGYSQGSPAENAESYLRVNRDFTAGPMAKQDYVVENFLVNYTFQNFLYFEGDAVDQFYVALILHFVLIPFHLAAISGFNHKTDALSLQETIRQYSRFWEHDRNTMEKCIAFLQENSFATMPYLTVLMKN